MADNHYLPIGTIVRTCNDYYRPGLLGKTISGMRPMGFKSVQGYDVKFIGSPDIGTVYTTNLEVISRTNLTDLEAFLYNLNESTRI